MAVLSLNDIHKAYGDNRVLAGVSLQIHQGEKVGLVGPNGAGKTTILKIITAEEEADEGQVFLSRGTSLGYLEQKPVFSTTATLQEYLRETVRDILSIKEELSALEEEMSLSGTGGDHAALDSLMKRYGHLSQLYENKGGYTLESRFKAVARGLGFKEEDLVRCVEEFSGGEKTRVQLAALILKEPELLLLDEPTNYLDLEALEWLENYLRNWSGALLVVSHDRYFLDRVVSRIAALERGELKCCRGNYSAYAAQQQLEKASEEKAYNKQQAAVKKDLDFIRTASADERSKRQAHSREKRLGKMQLLSLPRSDKNIDLNFTFAGRSSRMVLSFDKVSKAFGETKLFAEATFEIEWGDRVALVGPNGAGKTTLLRLITGEEPRSSGHIRVGHGVRIAYFDQEQKRLELNSTPLDTVMEHLGLMEAEARKHLSRFLFRGEEVFKKVGDLSGGERSRLALAKVALSEGNFLILDEPTNHLDVKGVEELETTLAGYPGTLLVVSHDRYFMARTTTKILEIREGQVSLYRGTYHEFEEARAAGGEKTAAVRKEDPETVSRREKREMEKEEREKLLALRREKRRLEKRLAGLEEEIHAGEEKISLLQEQLADPGTYDNFNEARKITEEFKAVRHRVSLLYGEWEKIAAELEELPGEESLKIND
ncbi:MAG: ABC transporter ATP-binding protein [Dethiobacter sp.]|jgi:ATP-binding cassette subfamily F protein 3|nr:MAG: ABC transporter ATP-binding protein [Dethiobacter sp.]